MSKAKAKELDNHKHGDRNLCNICNPKKDRIRYDQTGPGGQYHLGPIEDCDNPAHRGDA